MLYHIISYHIILYYIILYYIIQYTCVHVLALFLPDIKMPHILSHVNIGLQYYPQCQHVYIYILLNIVGFYTLHQINIDPAT